MKPGLGAQNLTREQLLARQVEALEARLRSQDERFAGVLDALASRPDLCVVQLDGSGRVTSMSPAGLSMLGVSDEPEVLGVPMVSLVAEADRGRLEQLIAQALAGERVDGSFEACSGHALQASLWPLGGSGGTEASILGVCRDMTEAHRPTEELNAALELNRRMIEALPCGIVHVTATGEIAQSNAEAMRILGMDQESLESSETGDFDSKTIWENGSPCPVQDYPVTRALVTGEAQPPATIGTRRAADGAYGWAIYTAVPVKHPQTGAVTGAVVTFVDITARKRREDERARFEEQLRHTQKLESLGVLAGGIAHDFNNLLVGILGNAGLARLGLEEGSAVLESVTRIEESSLRASELTRQLLAYTGRGRLEREQIDLSELASGMAGLLELSLPKNALVQEHLSADLPPIEADATQLRQVVMNLVTNAAEAQDGAAVVHLRTGVVSMSGAERAVVVCGDQPLRGAFVFLEVQDAGVGMDKETLERIFDPFFTTKATGRGLGLSTALGIIRGHDGALTVETAPGAGTTFRVLLPLGEQARALAASEPVRGPVAARARAGTVLVVDDNRVVRDVATLMLRRLGYEVLQAVDGAEGVATFEARARDIDVVVLDAVMPVLDGPAALAEMLRIRPDAKVIWSSGYPSEDAREHLGDLEIAGFLEKPYTPEQLVVALQQALAD